MSTPSLESSSMRARRLFVLVAVVLAPMFAAACGTMPTANDGPTPPPPADSTKRGDNFPWN